MDDSTEGARAPQEPPKLMTVEELAGVLGIDYDTALEVCGSEYAPPMVKVGRRCRPVRALVDGWLEECAAVGAEFGRRRSR